MIVICFFFSLNIDFNVIKTRKVKELMTETDRKHYCTRTPYVDAPQSIGNGVTISAPHMVFYEYIFTTDTLVICIRICI